MDRVCFVYVHGAVFDGIDVCKVGITYTPAKRLNEFNNGLTYRAYHYPKLKGVVFKNEYQMMLRNRHFCKQVESHVHYELNLLMLREFGREVFACHHDKAIEIIEQHLGGLYDSDN